MILDGSIPDKDVRRMIAESYDLVTASPTKRIYEAVQKIPKGQLQPTDRLRNWREIRKWHVRSEMHCIKSRSGKNSVLPCSQCKGELSGAFAFGGADEQAKRLEADGIEVINGRVDLGKYRWKNQDYY